MKKEIQKNTFTKSIMTIVVFLYFIGALIGTILVVTAAVIDIEYRQQISTDMFISYASYLAAPTATAIGFYAWKSKAENLLKIQQSHDEIHGPTTSDLVQNLAQMGGNN